MSNSLGSLQQNNLHFVVKVHYILGAAPFNWPVLLRFVIQLLNIIASACFCIIWFDFLVLRPLLPDASIYFPVGI